MKFHCAVESQYRVVFCNSDGVFMLSPFRFVRMRSFRQGVRGANYVENDINVHRFSFIAKKGLHALKVRVSVVRGRAGADATGHVGRHFTSQPYRLCILQKNWNEIMSIR